MFWEWGQGAVEDSGPGGLSPCSEEREQIPGGGA